jgi:hypothetical protein
MLQTTAAAAAATATATTNTTAKLNSGRFVFCGPHFRKFCPGLNLPTYSIVPKAICCYILRCFVIRKANKIIHLELTTWQKNGGK